MFGRVPVCRVPEDQWWKSSPCSDYGSTGLETPFGLGSHDPDVVQSYASWKLEYENQVIQHSTSWLGQVQNAGEAEREVWEGSLAVLIVCIYTASCIFITMQ